jgi:hypothetical protein
MPFLHSITPSWHWRPRRLGGQWQNHSFRPSSRTHSPPFMHARVLLPQVMCGTLQVAPVQLAVGIRGRFGWKGLVAC